MRFLVSLELPTPLSNGRSPVAQLVEPWVREDVRTDAGSIPAGVSQAKSDCIFEIV